MKICCNCASQLFYYTIVYNTANTRHLKKSLQFALKNNKKHFKQLDCSYVTDMGSWYQHDVASIESSFYEAPKWCIPLLDVQMHDNREIKYVKACTRHKSARLLVETLEALGSSDYDIVREVSRIYGN